MRELLNVKSALFSHAPRQKLALTNLLKGAYLHDMKTGFGPLSLFCALALASMTPNVLADTPKEGEIAPLVEGKDQKGDSWKLADEVGKKVVLLYFYPKDDTPGCTKEACGLRDRMDTLKSDNVEVVGVSFDSADSHQK